MFSRSQFLCSIAGAGAALALPGCARGTEDPAKTQRFAAFLQAILAGKVPSGMDAAMQSAVTPQAAQQMAGKLAPLGAFVKLRFVMRDEADGYNRFFYRGIFKNGTQPFLFVLDQGGKVAGFFLQ